jgi:hypothetical protein
MIREIMESGRLEKMQSKGAFKTVYRAILAGQVYFLAFEKSYYECKTQIGLHELMPDNFVRILQHGTYHKKRYSVEEFHEFRKTTTDDAYSIGKIAGELYQRTLKNDIGKVHFDPHNILINSEGRVLFIDVNHIGSGNIHDLVGTFTDIHVGESNLEATINNPDDFLKGVTDSTGLDLAYLKKIMSEVPTYEQNMRYMMYLG